MIKKENNSVSINYNIRKDLSYEDSFNFHFLKSQLFEDELHVDLQGALWNLEPHKINYNPDGVDVFFNLVRAMNLRPIGKMREMLRSDEINLKYYGFNPKIMKAICEALEKNPHVKILNLEDNILSLDACYHLNKLLLRNTTLVILNLCGCKIGPNGIKQLTDSLIRNENVQELNLENCDLYDEGMRLLAECMQENATVKNLNLKNNNLTYESVEYINPMLIYNYTIEKLDLSMNNLASDNGCELIFDALLNNTSCKDIDLSWNNCGSEIQSISMTQICEFLSKNPSIEILKLQFNRITEGDMDNLGHALLKNTNLKKLYLGGNPIKNSTINQFMQMIRNKSGLELLELSHTSIDKTKDKILKILNQEN